MSSSRQATAWLVVGAVVLATGTLGRAVIWGVSRWQATVDPMVFSAPEDPASSPAAGPDETAARVMHRWRLDPPPGGAQVVLEPDWSDGTELAGTLRAAPSGPMLDGLVSRLVDEVPTGSVSLDLVRPMNGRRRPRAMAWVGRLQARWEDGTLRGRTFQPVDQRVDAGAPTGPGHQARLRASVQADAPTWWWYRLQARPDDPALQEAFGAALSEGSAADLLDLLHDVGVVRDEHDGGGVFVVPERLGRLPAEAVGAVVRRLGGDDVPWVRQGEAAAVVEALGGGGPADAP